MLADHAAMAMPSPMTRDDHVRLEGAEAARRGFAAHDNPYRSGSADGMSWRQGFDQSSSGRIRVEG